MPERGSADETPDEPDDAALVAAAKRNRDAFALLYARYLPAVLRFCASRLGDPNDAEDATSHIFAKAMVALPSCRDEAFRGWLFTIARNVIIDTYRRRHPARPLDDVIAITDPAAGPEEIALAEDERARLRALLVHLSRDQRQVVELRLAGLSGKEIASALQMSIPAVKTHQFRAVARLRDVLGVNAAGRPPFQSAKQAASDTKGDPA